MKNNVDIDKRYATKDAYGNIRAKNQKGITLKQVLKGLVEFNIMPKEWAKTRRSKWQIYKDIHTFFEIVCNGIRIEYEEGASHRDFERDKKTLDKLLVEAIFGDDK